MGLQPRQLQPLARAITSAALTGSAADALRAFALHPLVGSLEAARTLAAAALTGAAAVR